MFLDFSLHVLQFCYETISIYDKVYTTFKKELAAACGKSKVMLFEWHVLDSLGHFFFKF